MTDNEQKAEGQEETQAQAPQEPPALRVDPLKFRQDGQRLIELSMHLGDVANELSKIGRAYVEIDQNFQRQVAELQKS